jgi:nucleoside-diphosphate-sugar epimerase
MKIVLTGHKGFIGSHYLEYANNDNTVEVVKTFDKRDNEDLCNPRVAYDSPDCDVLVHMAATNGTRLFYEQPTEVATNNTLPTFNLVHRYQNTNTKIVFTSTCEIFNGAIDAGYYPVPTDEQVPVMFNDITNPRWSYSIPKALGENLVANCGAPWLVIRYFNVYGPGQIDHFINEFVERCKQGEYYIKGDDTRSFCYIDNAIEMTHSLVKNHNGYIVNVGNQEEVKISIVAKLIMGIMGINPDKLEVRPGPVGSAKRRCPDTTLVRELTGFTDYTPLQDGLRKTIESLL